MIDAVFYDADGLILEIIQYDDDTASEDIDLDAPEDAVGWIDDAEADIDDDYIVGGVTTEKPGLIAITSWIVGVDGYAYTLAENLPIGTVIIDMDTGTTTTLAAVEDLIFSTYLAGKWSIGVSPPFPYKSQIIEVKTDADL